MGFRASASSGLGFRVQGLRVVVLRVVGIRVSGSQGLGLQGLRVLIRVQGLLEGCFRGFKKGGAQEEV